MNNTEGCDDPDCFACCEHEELDHGVCCTCGEDRMEHMMAMAYDRAKYSQDD